MAALKTNIILLYNSCVYRALESRRLQHFFGLPVVAAFLLARLLLRLGGWLLRLFSCWIASCP